MDYGKYPQIRDKDDILLLASAIETNADIFITGDKDFDEIKIIKPKIMKPREYIDEYME
jgi:predicted nucleic acid-binding protein